jgi:hypothetical protein
LSSDLGGDDEDEDREIDILAVDEEKGIGNNPSESGALCLG